jgi:hypothetical protein
MADDVNAPPVIDLTQLLSDAKIINTGLGSVHSNATGGNDSDHIESESHEISDPETEELEGENNWMKKTMSKIRSLSNKNMKERERAIAEHKGRRARDRDKRRSRSGNLLGSHGVVNRSDYVDLQSSDPSPPGSSDEDMDDDDTDDEDEDAIIFTKDNVRYKRSDRSRPRNVKRKARKPVQTSSGMDSANQSTPPLGRNEAKRRSRMRTELADSSSASEEIAEIQSLVRRKRVTKLTAEIRHRADKKQKPEEKKKKWAHTSVGRAGERISKATAYLELFYAKKAIKKCSDVNCKCPSKYELIVEGRTLSASMSAADKKQWLLEKLTNMPMDWTYFIIERNKACRSCFEAYYGIKVNY